MFSATKFVVACAIVALSGGFLLSGVLTQQPSDEPLPAASASATAQAEPTTEATAESEPVPDATVVPPSDSNLGPGAFTLTGSLERGREEHTATLLSDGRVLVVGGADYSEGVDYVTPAEAFDPLTGSFSPAGSLTEGRVGHTATLLADGRILVVGGSDNVMGFTTGLASVEIWDPATESFGRASPLLQSRGRPATLLADGRVLIVGGVVVENDDDRSLASAEIWDPATEVFSPTGSLEAARVVHTATLLPDGRVLVVGGTNPDGVSPASAEIWDPATGSFSAAGSLLQPRGWHSATLLPDGRVLIVGGRGGDGSAPAEIWDPGTESFGVVEALVDVRDGHDAVLLPGGPVLIVRGAGPGSRFTEMAIWEPVTDSLVSAASPIEERARYSLTALPDGRALLVGGNSANGEPASAEVWQPSESQPDADDMATTALDLLPGVDLVTEEVEPGVYRVLSDGVRDFSEGVHGVAVSAKGDGWVELGTSRNWSVVRLGEPGMSQTLGRKDPWRLGLTSDGDPMVSSLGGVRVLDGEAWAKAEPTAYSECVLPVYGRTMVGTEGGCWTVVNRGDAVLERIDADGTRTAFTRAELSLEADQRTGEPNVAPDGTILISVHRPAGRGVIFEGLLEYDGSTWSSIPYDGDDTEAVDGGDAVDADGVYWALRGVIGMPWEILSWDGESWTSHPLELEEGRNWDLLPVQPWPNGIVWFGSDARWDGSTLDAAEPAVQWGKGLAPASAPDGSLDGHRGAPLRHHP